MRKYILFLTLLILLAGCSASGSRSPTASGGSYADQLRARASGTNGQPGAQTPTAPEPPPATPAPPPQVQQVIAEPTAAVVAQSGGSSSVGAIEQIGSDYWPDDATISLTAFITSPLAMFVFATVVAGIAIRRRERK